MNTLTNGAPQQPQPDLAILKPRQDNYESKLPSAQDVLLLIEVADTTLDYDRDAKIPTYAQHDIPEAWLINLQMNTLSIFLDPTPKGYRRLLTPQRGDMIAPHLLPGIEVGVADILF